MFGFITKIEIDDRLMDFFERKSKKIQLLTGYDCLNQADFAAFMAAVSFTGMYLFLDCGLPAKIFGGAIVPVGILVGLNYRKPLDEEIRSLYKTGAKNPFRIKDINFRMSTLLFLLIVLISEGVDGIIRLTTAYPARNVLGITGATSFFVYGYLVSCTPLPPGKSKVRKFFESLRGSPKTVENESP